MTIIGLGLAVIFGIALVGLFVYLIETFLPMSPPFTTGIRIVAGIVVLVILIAFVGHLFGVNQLPAFR